MINVIIFSLITPVYSNIKSDSIKIDSSFYKNGSLKTIQYFLNNERVYKYEEYYMSGSIKKIGYHPKDTFGLPIKNQIFNNFELCLNKNSRINKCDYFDTSIYSSSSFAVLKSYNPFFYEWYENGIPKNKIINIKNSDFLQEIIFDENCDTLSIQNFKHFLINERLWWALDGDSKFYEKDENIFRFRNYKKGILIHELIFKNEKKIVEFDY